MTIADLRRTRMARGLSITELSARTRIGVGYLQKIEEGDFGALPPGFYARAFVRAYAEGIGLDPDRALGVLADTLPAPQGASAETEPGGAGSEPDIVPGARTHVLKQLLQRHETEAGTTTRVSAVTRAARPLPRRLLAASADGVLLACIYLAVLGITAVYCGITLNELVQAGGPAVFTVLSLITVLYVLLMGGVAGKTIGAMLLDVSLVSKPERPLDLPAIARRSVDCVRADVAAAGEVKALVEGLFGWRRAA